MRFRTAGCCIEVRRRRTLGITVIAIWNCGNTAVVNTRYLGWIKEVRDLRVTDTNVSEVQDLWLRTCIIYKWQDLTNDNLKSRSILRQHPHRLQILATLAHVACSTRYRGFGERILWFNGSVIGFLIPSVYAGNFPHTLHWLTVCQ